MYIYENIYIYTYIYIYENIYIYIHLYMRGGAVHSVEHDPLIKSQLVSGLSL